MRIELEKLEGSGGSFSHVYQVSELPFEEAELRMTEPATVQGTVHRHNGEAELRGKLHAKVSIPCARCLKPVELPIDVKFSERFVPAVSWRDEEAHELREEDLNLAVFDGEAIELDDVVREEILLAIPGQVLCREDCQGLCPVCGVDRNESSCECENMAVDSRWEKLKDLRF
jgi:uncharacterized protein